MIRPAALLVILASSIGAQEGEIEVDPDRFAAEHALVCPSPDELDWLKIDWLIDLGEARRRAAGEGKPIFLWEMDGHPLGCT